MVDPGAFSWWGKIRPPPPGPSRMYIVNIIWWQLVTIKLMRGRVPQRRSGFQSLVGAMSWNIGKAHGIGRNGQKCAWGGRCSVLRVKRVAARAWRGDNFLLMACIDSLSILFPHSLPSLLPFPVNPAQYFTPNSFPCQLSRIDSRIPLESFASSLPCNSARN